MYKTNHLCKCNRSKCPAENCKKSHVVSEITTLAETHDPLFASEIEQLSGWNAVEFYQLLAEYRVPGKFLCPCVISIIVFCNNTRKNYQFMHVLTIK